MNNTKTNKRNNRSTQQLISNLRKQLSEKTNLYNERIYAAAILEVAEQIFPTSNNNLFNTDYLPYVGNVNTYEPHVDVFASHR